MVTPGMISERFDSSPTYMAKVLGALARQGILDSRRGLKGGFSLNRTPDKITLLEIVEAAQGAVVGNYCQELPKNSQKNSCGYHHAMQELQDAVQGALGKWTVQDILKHPMPTVSFAPDCRMRAIRN